MVLGMARMFAAVLLLLCGAATAPAMERVETKHYVLLAETSMAQAKEYGRVLEAAWPEYRKFFGAVPDEKLTHGKKLVVRFCATKASFDAALKADGIEPPAAGGYYAPRTRTAYLWKQPTIYYTRCLLLHEAAHQFHFLSRTGNRMVPVEWYVEGIAEYLCRHEWDGKTLKLAVVPVVSLKDYPHAALSQLDRGSVLAAAGKSGVLSRPLDWALVSFLMTAPNRRRFQVLRDRYDRGRADPALLFRLFGPPKKLSASLRAWLTRVQEPLAQVFNQWEGIGPGELRGVSGPLIVSFCRVKGEARSLTAKLVVPTRSRSWTGGLLLAYASRKSYTVGIIRSGRIVEVDRRQSGRWRLLTRKPCPAPAKDGSLALSATRRGKQVTFNVGGAQIGTFDVPGATLGLCVEGGRATYRSVKWIRGTPAPRRRK